MEKVEKEVLSAKIIYKKVGKLKKITVLGLPVSCLTLRETVGMIVHWAKKKSGKTIYCCTLNEVMMASEDINFKRILTKGDILTPDGMPLVWGLKIKGFKNAERVYGPELLESFINQNKANRIKQLFIGNEKNKKYFENFGNYLSLSYRNEFGEVDYKMMLGEIEKSRAKLIWLGLGAKKQIVVANRLFKILPDRIYITVGAAFDFISKNKKQAPRWLRQSGGEWLFRLVTEPKRLGKRYLQIFRFVFRNIKKM
jgi:N-acetylglucosaminyldiphosphoundecaprenol N-acetyl-beta-D-mannosaminyltransferase